MIAIKSGPRLAEPRTLAEQLQSSVWLAEGKNSAGEMLPAEWELDRAHVWLETLLLLSGHPPEFVGNL